MDRDVSLAMHAARDQAYHNETPSKNRIPEVPDHKFRWQDEVEAGFEYINELEVDEVFDFVDEVVHCHATWRRRRFWAQKKFWRALLTVQLKHYSFHYRFDLEKYDKLYRIPRKFSGCL
jgi:hypothetical protein